MPFHSIVLRLFSLAFAWTMLAPRAAAAAPQAATELRLALEVADDQAPTHVCVVSPHGDPSSTLESLNQAQANLCSREPGQAEKCGKDLVWTADSFYFNWLPHYEPPEGNQLMKGIQGLSRQHNEHVCDYGPGTGCLPLFSLRGFESPQRASIRCTENTTYRRRGDKVNGRALLISLSTQQKDSGPYIQDLQLNGKSLLVTTKAVTGVDHVVRVLGGYYAPIGEVRFAPSDKSLTLKIEARCQWATIGIPRIASLATLPDLPADDPSTAAKPQTEPRKFPVEIGLGLDGEPDMTKPPSEGIQGCVSSLQDTALRVLIPYEPHHRKVLVIRGRSNAPHDKRTGSQRCGKKSSDDVADASKPADPTPTWKLVASWLGPRPPQGEGGRDASGRVNASVQQLTFSWRADSCLYPRGACPTARVSTSGQKCTRQNREIDDNGLCGYKCTAPKFTDIDFPTRITFSPPLSNHARRSVPTQGWSIDIRSIDQQLEGYVEPDERVIMLDTSEWQAQPEDKPRAAATPPQTRGDAEDPNTPGAKMANRGLTVDELRDVICPSGRNHDDIFYVEFRTGDQKTHRVELHDMEGLGCERRDEKDTEKAKPSGDGSSDDSSGDDPGEGESNEDDSCTEDSRDKNRPRAPAPRPRPLVKLPRVSCEEPIAYRFVGERSFQQDSVSVKDGKLKLRSPMSTARVIYFAVTLMPVSFQAIVAPKDLRMPRSGLLYSPAIEASLVIRPSRATVRGWRFNVDATFIGSPRPYLALGDNDKSSDPEPQRSVYARWYVGFSFVSPWLASRRRSHYMGPALALGAGAQVGVGYPFSRSDIQRLGKADAGLVALRLDLRVRLHRHIEAIVSPRVLLADEVIRFTTDLRGQPLVERSRAMVSILFPTLGLTFLW